MGAYSTVNITREEALNRIYAVLENASNEELEDVLLDLYRDKVCDNYHIVEEKKNV